MFLISSESVEPGSYTLTELKYARQKWPDPRQRILPVMVRRTDYLQIPNYLKAVTVLEPEGSIPAEVVAELETWRDHKASFRTEDVDARPAERPHRKKTSSGDPLGKRLAAGALGAFGGLMILLSVVDAAVGGISEGGILIGAVSLGLAYGLWPRHKKPDY